MVAKKKPSHSPAKPTPAILPETWAKIEADYRAGVKSLRQIGGDHGCTEGAIRKRAKAEDWERDLNAKIKAKADALVRKDAVREEVRNANRVPESVIVEANSQALAAVQLSHRVDIQRGRALTMKLLEELERTCDNPDLLEKIAEMLLDPAEGAEETEAAARRRERMWEAFNKALSLGGRVSTMKQLADSLKTLVGLEREAFGLGDDGKGGGKLEDWLDTL